MNKSELVTRLAERFDGDRVMAVAAVNGVLEEIERGVARGERVTLTGFGTFEPRARAARTGRNPRTGEAVPVAAAVVPAFRAGSAFRSAVSQSDVDPLDAPVDSGVDATEEVEAVAAPTLLQIPLPVPVEDGAGAAGTGTKGKKKAAGAGTSASAGSDPAPGKAGKKGGKKAAGKSGKKARKASA